jgi:hypothetical protein
MVKAWVTAARGRWKELLVRRQVDKVANDALPSDNIYLIEGKGSDAPTSRESHGP